MDNEKILTDEEIQKSKNAIINNISKIGKDEITKYDFSEVKEEKKTIWDKIKKVFGL